MTTEVRRIQLRRGLTADWVAADPVLADGELGVATDTSMAKLGDGIRTWTQLPTFPNAVAHSRTTQNLPIFL